MSAQPVTPASGTDFAASRIASSETAGVLPWPRAVGGWTHDHSFLSWSRKPVTITSRNGTATAIAPHRCAFRVHSRQLMRTCESPSRLSY